MGAWDRAPGPHRPSVHPTAGGTRKGWDRVTAPLLGWAAFAAVYFLLAFRPGIVRSDDFGYLRSVIGTLRAGRPFLDDWLEPFSAVFSSACALLYRLTGSFLLSTWGFQAACALALYPLLYRLLAVRLQPRHAALSALAMAGLPLYLAKAADFHAGICTLDLFLASLILFETDRMGWFYAAAFLAFANRQNQICLLILPAWKWFFPMPAGKSRRRTADVVAPCLYALAALALTLAMNGTYAARNAGFRHSAPGPLLAAFASAAIAGGLLSLGWLSAFSFLRGRPGPLANARWRFPAAASLAVLAFLPWWDPSLLRMDTPMFGYLGWSRVNFALPWILIASYWLLDFRLLRPRPYLALIGGYVLVTSLRGIWWDYYFLEIALLCLLLALQGPGISGMDLPGPALVFLGALLAADIGYAYLLKVQSDKQRLAVVILEGLERQDRVRVDRMTGAPFGLLGWKLFGYFTSHEGRDYGELADFLGYVRKDRVTVETQLPWRRAFKSALPAQAVMIDSGFCRVGFASVRYRVADLHGPDSGVQAQGRFLVLDSARYRPLRFPLDDGEWKEYLDVPGRR